MTKRPTSTPLDIAVANESDPGAEVKEWVARRLRFERLLASLEHKAGYRPGVDHTPLG